MTQRDNAVAAWGAGYAPFPLCAGTKTPPEGMRWRKMSGGDVEEIVAWWNDYPDDNVGIDCGKSGLLVIDCDSEAAMDRFVRLWYAREGTELADSGTAIMATRPGRWQTWLRQPANVIGCPKKHRLGAETDVKGDGGMVLAPGSLINGYARHFIRGDLDTLLPCPAWLEPLARGETRRPRAPARPVPAWTVKLAEKHLKQAAGSLAAKLPPGRNDMLNAQAFSLRPALPALGYERIEEELYAASEQNGLVAEDGASSVRGTIRSGLTAKG